MSNFFKEKPFFLAGSTYESRLLVGTGKYSGMEEARLAIEASGAQIVTVAIRRIHEACTLDNRSILDVISPKKYTILPNTAGCFNAIDAVRTCRLSRELLDGHSLVKLEVLADRRTLLPNVIETMKAASILVNEGFKVMVYTTDDPVVAREIEAIGCSAIMPLASMIGSGLGICNPYNLKIILEEASIPVLIDAGIGTASDSTIAMEMGCDAVLINSAIARAKDPINMAKAMKYSIKAGRMAFLSGRMEKSYYGNPSSPLKNMID